MTAKEYLNHPWELNKVISDKLEKAERLRQDLYGRGVNYDNNSHSSNCSTDAMGRAVQKIVDFEAEIDTMIDELVENKIQLEKEISALPDQRYIKILERRYLFFEPFDKISESMGYSVKHIYRLHNNAVRSFEKLRLNATECD